MPDLEQPGNFRGEIVSYGLNKADSGAVAVCLNVKIEDIWHQGEWCDYRKHDLDVSGSVWVVKINGSLVQGQVESLMSAAGWDGKFESIQHQTWKPSKISFVVTSEEYKGETQFRLAWVKDYEQAPSGGGNVDEATAKALDQQHGSNLRALAGNSTRNSTKPSGQPPEKSTAPKEAAKTPEPVSDTEADDPDNDLPF